MTQLKRAAIAVILLLTSEAKAQALVDIPTVKVDTAQILLNTVEAYPNCIEFCITAFQLRVRIGLTGPEFFIVPVVEHNNPDNLILISENLGQEAFIEWAAITGGVQQEIQNLILATVTGIPTESYGGNSEFGDFGEHQSTTLYEGEVLGNPASLISRALGVESGGPTSGAFGELGGVNAPIWDLVRGQFNTQELTQQALEQFSAFTTLQEIPDLIQAAQAAASVAAAAAGQPTASFRSDGLMCASQSTPFHPYYLSSIDSALWRGDFPLVDGVFAQRLLSPSNGIRPEGAFLIEDWGWVFPRIGFINNEHGGRSAAVMTRRADSIPSEELAGGRLRVLNPASQLYQNISPAPGNVCASNVANLETEIDGDGAYSYTGWVRYQCSTSTVGSAVVTIDIPDICL